VALLFLRNFFSYDTSVAMYGTNKILFILYYMGFGPFFF
jgi:hypothetical protein